MERKNTVLLTVIAVATLLVAVVGATFAYFTATTNSSDQSAGTAEVNTAKMASIQFNASKIEGSKNVVYPGTNNFIGASIEATASGGEADVEYDVSYTLTGSVTVDKAFTKGDITWKLYKVTTDVSTDAVTCQPVTDGGNNQFTQTCSLNAALTTPVKSGTIAKEDTTGGEVTYTGTIKTGSPKEYFILVYEYESTGEDQTEDAGTKKITASITSIEASDYKQATA